MFEAVILLEHVAENPSQVDILPTPGGPRKVNIALGGRKAMWMKASATSSTASFWSRTIFFSSLRMVSNCLS